MTEKIRSKVQIPAPDSDSYIDDLLERPISYHRCFAKLTVNGNRMGACAALMLSQACFWSIRTSRADGWFWKTAQEWEDETGLTTREQQTARKSLKNFPFWNEDLRGVPAKMHYLLDRPALRRELSAQFGENAKLGLRKRATGENETPNKIGENAQHLSLSKTTTETPQRIRSLESSQDTSIKLVQNAETASGSRVSLPKKLCSVPRFGDSKREDLYRAIYRKEIENALLDCRRMPLLEAVTEAAEKAALSLTTNRSGIMLTVDFKSLAASVVDRLSPKLPTFQAISNFDSRSRHIIEAIINATIDAAIPLCSESRKQQEQTAFGF